MQSDQQEIRKLVATWMAATKAGDINAILDLTTDDVVFLVPGRPPMRKEEFESALRIQTGESMPKIDGSSEIQEIQVVGDWAFMWTKLSMTSLPLDGSEPLKRAGHTLTVLRKSHGKWLLARDANLLAPMKKLNE